MKDKLFGHQLGDNCHPIIAIKEMMKIEGITEMNVEDTRPAYGCEWFFCLAYHQIGERNTGQCGKECKDYDPRNGKSGICKHNTFLREGTGKFKTINL